MTVLSCDNPSVAVAGSVDDFVTSKIMAVKWIIIVLVCSNINRYKMNVHFSATRFFTAIEEQFGLEILKTARR